MAVRAPRKGENYELSIDLNSGWPEKRKDAIKVCLAIAFPPISYSNLIQLNSAQSRR
jgi:hypothetical protein